MRAIAAIALCLLAGSVYAAEHNFHVGKQYTFESSSSAIVDIPDLEGDHETGIRLKRKIVVSAWNDDTLWIVPTIEAVYEVNNLNNDNCESEREVQLQPQYKQWLEAPFQATYKEGVFSSLRIEKNLPEWVVNIQRALAHLLSTKIQKGGDLTTKQEFRVYERTLYGEGDVVYQIYPQGPGRSSRDRQQLQHPHFQQRGQPFSSSESSDCSDSFDSSCSSSSSSNSSSSDSDSSSSSSEEPRRDKCSRQYCKPIVQPQN